MVELNPNLHYLSTFDGERPDLFPEDEQAVLDAARATGAIVTVKAMYELMRTGGRKGLITMCIGGGQGIAAIFERV